MGSSLKSAAFLIESRLADAARGDVDAYYDLGIAFSTGTGGLVVSPHVGAVQERQAERHVTALRQGEQALPHAQTRPADEGLRRPRPRPVLGRHGPPLGPVLVAPHDRAHRTAQILGRRLAPGPALVQQRFKRRPLHVRQHGNLHSEVETSSHTTRSRANRP